MGASYMLAFYLSTFLKCMHFFSCILISQKGTVNLKSMHISEAKTHFLSQFITGMRDLDNFFKNRNLNKGRDGKYLWIISLAPVLQLVERCERENSIGCSFFYPCSNWGWPEKATTRKMVSSLKERSSISGLGPANWTAVQFGRPCVTGSRLASLQYRPVQLP